MSVTAPTTYTTYDAGSGSSIILPQVTGIVANALLLAVIMQVATNGNLASITPPAGWTLLQTQDDGQGQGQTIRTNVYWKVTTGTDVSASSYTFTSGGNIDNQGTLFQVLGSNLSVPYVFSEAGGTTNSPSITPSVANSLLIMLGFQYASGSAASGYGIVTSNPTWTELYDFSPANAAFMAMATAIRPQTTATGIGSMSYPPAIPIHNVMLIGIAPATSLTVSEIVTMTDGLSTTISMVLSEIVTMIDVVASSAQTIFQNIVKNISNWINGIKH